MESVLEDVDSAPISEPLRATLKMLGKLTLEPQAFGPEDVEAVRRHGVSDGALRDAICIGALFNIIDRCADSLAFELLDDLEEKGRFMLEVGYDRGPAPDDLP